MIVHLKFFAGLRDAIPGRKSPYSVDLPADATVEQVLDRFGVPRDKPKILLVNGRHADLRHVLREGDTLSVFPPVAGG
jgi:molybdopterin converting factor small subunit